MSVIRGILLQSFTCCSISPGPFLQVRGMEHPRRASPVPQSRHSTHVPASLCQSHALLTLLGCGCSRSGQPCHASASLVSIANLDSLLWSRLLEDPKQMLRLCDAVVTVRPSVCRCRCLQAAAGRGSYVQLRMGFGRAQDATEQACRPGPSSTSAVRVYGLV